MKFSFIYKQTVEIDCEAIVQADSEKEARQKFIDGEVEEEFEYNHTGIDIKIKSIDLIEEPPRSGAV